MCGLPAFVHAVSWTPEVGSLNRRWRKPGDDGTARLFSGDATRVLQQPNALSQVDYLTLDEFRGSRQLCLPLRGAKCLLGLLLGGREMTSFTNDFVSSCGEWRCELTIVC